MSKVYFFLGFGALAFLFFSSINGKKGTSGEKYGAALHTPQQIEALGQQLGFIADFSRSALRKIDNPGIYGFTDKVNESYFDLFTSFKELASEESFHITYLPTPEDKRKIFQLKNLGLRHFEPSYLEKLIPEMEAIHQISKEATLENSSAEMMALLKEIEQFTDRYLSISKELLDYQEYL